jgi:hypothetical protein
VRPNKVTAPNSLYFIPIFFLYNLEHFDVWRRSMANSYQEINKIVSAKMDVLAEVSKKIKDGKNKE